MSVKRSCFDQLINEDLDGHKVGDAISFHGRQEDSKRFDDLGVAVNGLLEKFTGHSVILWGGAAPTGPTPL